jgi:ceramide glucosyltransferase
LLGSVIDLRSRVSGSFGFSEMNFADWAAVFCIASTGCHLASLAVTAARLRRADQPAPSPGTESPVSLLRPVCGIDNFAAETLASTFRIDYPNYEIIFCVARADDPSMAVLHGLIDAHPEVPARLLVGDDRISANPKLNNLVKGWEAAQHQWIVLADSNVLMPPDYMRRLLSRWRPDTGAVCSMPIASCPHNFWAEIECAFLNTLQARYQYVSESLGFGFAQGKTMLFRRDLVERGGGIRALAADAAEDAATTKMVHSLGLHVHLVDTPFEQPLGWRSARQVWSRQLRWARLRRASFPGLFLPEIFLGSVFPTLAAAVAASGYGLSVPLSVTLLWVTWFGAEGALAECAGWHRSLGLAVALLVRDLLLPALWIGALLGTDFVWRGNEMTADGRPRGRFISMPGGRLR